MGDLYSKPASATPKPSGGAPQSCSQGSRPKDPCSNVPHAPGIDHLPNATLEAISRFHIGGPSVQGGSHSFSRSGITLDQPFASSGMDRLQRNQMNLAATSFNSSFLTNEILAAAQLGGQLTPTQLNALVAAYSQHQQQTHLSNLGSNVAHNPTIQFPQSLASNASVSKPSSSPVPLRPIGTGSPLTGLHASRSSASHLTHSAIPSPQFALHQKRPASRQNPFPASHASHSTASTVGNRPPSASQILSPHPGQQQLRAPLQGHPGLPHAPHSGHHGSSRHLSEPGHPDQSSASLTHLNPASQIQSRHSNVASPSASPVPPSYQGRRSQLAPIGAHTNKRPRLTNSTQLPPLSSHHHHHHHQQQQQQPVAHQLAHTHSLLPLPVANHIVSTSLPGGMEAIMNAVVVNKAIASLSSCGNFLNSAAYGSASEAAAVAAALSPLFTAAVNNSTTLSIANASGAPSSVCSPNTFPGHFPVHHQRPSSATSNNPSVQHNLQQQQQEHHVLTQTYTNQLLPGPISNTGRVGYSHTTSATPPTYTIQSSVGSQQSSCLSGSMHLTSKVTHSTGIPPMPSRLPSGHLNHPHHHTTHSTPHSFHSSAHAALQGTTAHHVLGHGTLPQGSGVLRQQTKEPAYHPQVEAISPAPEESRLTDAQDAKFHREGEELLRQLDIVESDLQKQVGLERLLEKREARLTNRLASTGSLTEPLDSSAAASEIRQSPSVEPSPTTDLISDLERTFENPIQAFISENRQRTRQHHLIFTRLCGPHVKASPYALPLYRQPSDLPYLCAIRADFHQNFRQKLVRYLRRRRKAEQARLQYLAQHYAHHSTIFSKKMEKLLNSTKQRHRELRHRDIFEKTIPEVKKNREDRELSMSDGPKQMVSDDLESHCQSAGGTIVDGTQPSVYDPVEEMNKMKEYAIDPPIPLAPWQRRYRFIYHTGLITDCRAQLQDELDLSSWTDEEKQVFRERFLATPKNFLSIGSYLERKTVADCIRYYYLTKKKEGYKQLLKKHTARRRRAPQSDRTGGGGGGGSHHTGGGGSGVSGSSHFPVSLSSGHYTSSLNGLSESQHSICGSTNGPADSTKDNDHKPHKRDASSNPGPIGTSRTRTSRYRPTVGRQQPLNFADEPPIVHAKHHSVNLELLTCTKSADFDTLGVAPSESGSDSKPLRVTEPPISLPPNETTGKHEATDGDNLTLGAHAFNGDRLENKIVSLSSCSPAPAPGDSDADWFPTESHQSPFTAHSSTDAEGSTCIKDLIHFAIEKNLTRPWSRDPALPSNLSTEPSIDKLRLAHSTDFDSRTYRNSSPLVVETSLVPEFVHSTREPSSCKVDVGEAIPISSGTQSFPSAPAAELYAAAAQFAAVSASNEQLANAMQVAAAAAAMCRKNTDPRMVSSLSPASNSTSATGGPPTDSHLDYPVEQPKPDELDMHWDGLSQLPKPLNRSADQSHRWPVSTASSFDPADPKPSNTAILLGDFLTAQQLRRADPTAVSLPPSGISRTFPPVSLHLRCIDPNTLPVPVSSPACSRGHHAGSALAHRPSCDLLSSMLPTAFSESRSAPGTGSLSAEHAAWLALQAQAAVVATAASTTRTGRSDYGNAFAKPPRSVYSPLSPVPTNAGSLSPALHIKSLEDRPVPSRLRRLPPVEPTSDQPTSNDNIHLRSLSCMNTQIGIRPASETLVSSAAVLSVTAAQTPPPSGVPVTQPDQDISCAPGLISLNPATYIDALIHTHLNRDTRYPEDKGRSLQPTSASCSLASGHFKSARNFKTPSDLAAATPDGAAHIMATTNTLEEQINKAIAEEIRAQIRPYTFNSLTTSPSDADPHSTTASSVNFNTTSTVLASAISHSTANVPLKKRDRGSSLTIMSFPTKSSTEHTKPPKRLSQPFEIMDLKQTASMDFTAQATVDATSEPKTISFSRVNGIKLSYEFSGRANQDPRLKPRTWSYEDQSLSFAPSYLDGSPHLTGGLKCFSARVPTPARSADAIHPTTISPASSPGDVESLGNLEIDLAASDLQPPSSSLDYVVSSTRISPAPCCSKEAA